MENNIVKVQIASPMGLGMKIESKDKNTLNHSEQAFNNLLNIVNDKKVWDSDFKGSLSFPIVNEPSINVWDPNNKAAALNMTNSMPETALSYESYIKEASERYNIPEALINAVIMAESSFNASATSPAGAKGLMQLMDGTAKGLGVSNSYDPEQNINGGSKYLSMLLKKYDGELKVALAAYNAGPTRVDRTGIQTNADFEQLKAALPNETQHYVNKVISYL